MAVAPSAIHRGTVVIVRLPNDKARPAVVVRSDLLSELSYATVLPITSDLRDESSLRVDIGQVVGSGLVAASRVMTDWPQTVRLAAFGQIVGRLDTATMRRITQQLAVVLGLADGVPPSEE